MALIILLVFLRELWPRFFRQHERIYYKWRKNVSLLFFKVNLDKIEGELL